MPQIFDNISNHLINDLEANIAEAIRADFCVGYFNLRGWGLLADKIDQLTGGEGAECRLIIGMAGDREEQLRRRYQVREPDRPTNADILKRKKGLVERLGKQLTYGAPTNHDEAVLLHLKQQMADGKVRVKAFLRHPLHAKLYLLHRLGSHPRTAYLGSSNLTFSGLQGNGELNVDVRDIPATQVLAEWFEDRWNDRFCVDVSADLIQLIEEGWASDTPTPPYHIYLKMAYHLSREAQRGIDEFSIPEPFDSTLFDFQKKAVQIAARHLNQRGGVLIGDVVGLGKTLMATALVKIFEDDLLLETLIICPKNLVPMWENQVTQFGLKGRVMSISMVQTQLAELTRFRLIVIDESHNLRNREGKRYRAIREYIERMDSRVILLSATPYNKTYLDLSSQLRLFVEPEADLGIRPNALINNIGILEFNRRFENIPPRSLVAFEKSEYPEDWRELMSRFMVRRTRSFIRDNYAKEDERGKYLEFSDGRRSHFPTRHPHRLTFAENEQYRQLYREDVVDTITGLSLPRYGLGEYENKRHTAPPTQAEQRILDDLSRAGERLKGFSRTNLFKRLESSGFAFMLSLERHILRNYVYLHAIENGLPLPIGTQDAAVLDTQFVDEDVFGADEDGEPVEGAGSFGRFDPTIFQQRAAHIYATYAGQYRNRFRWLRSDLFTRSLRKSLREDALNLITVLVELGEWNAANDVQLAALADLLTTKHAHDKVLVFSQFADTVRYLAQELPKRGVTAVEGVTGDHADPTYAAWRFSPNSSDKRHAIAAENELRVLVATDVLSEGQNLQDAFVVVNYDLPWAIIRLIQRAGRVDRIGQQSQHIHVYSMWPAEGLEQIIRLRSRLRTRLRENAEVVGADEIFFADEERPDALRNLYNEQSGILDDDEDRDVDLVSYAYQIWKNATEANPPLREKIVNMADVVYSAKSAETNGVLLFLRTTLGNNALAWLDENGASVNQSQFDILNAAACDLDEPALPRSDAHHELVRHGVEQVMQEQQTDSVTLGRASGARYKIYERLNNYIRMYDNTLFANSELVRNVKAAIEQLSRYRLRQSTKDRLNRQLRSGINNESLARAVAAYFEEDQLCIVHEETEQGEPQIICSLGLLAVNDEATDTTKPA